MRAATLQTLRRAARRHRHRAHRCPPPLRL